MSAEKLLGRKYTLRDLQTSTIKVLSKYGGVGKPESGGD